MLFMFLIPPQVKLGGILESPCPSVKTSFKIQTNLCSMKKICRGDKIAYTDRQTDKYSRIVPVIKNIS